MANSTRLDEALDAPLFYGTCGTSSHCVPITAPGAESTNNLTRARRLGPRWQGQRQVNTQRAGPAALHDIPSPSKSPTEPPSQWHELSMRGDAPPVRQASGADFVVTMPLRTAAAPDSLRRELVDGASPLDAKKRSHLPWEICFALTTLTALILLIAIAWHTRAKRTNSGAVATANLRTAPANTSPVISPLNSGFTQDTVSAKSAARRDESKPDEAADRTRQPKVVVTNEKEFARPDRATNRAREKATTNRNANALVSLANEDLRSEGVPRGCAKAMLLLNAAAAKENARARNRLASMYAIGSCVPRDPVQAYRWLVAALDADPHNQWAQQNRDLILRQMTAEQRSQMSTTE
jgi:hypothetical protein